MQTKNILFVLGFYVSAAVSGQIEARYIFQGHTAAVNSIDLSPDGRYLVSGSKDETIRVWNIDSRQTEETISTTNSSVKRICFNNDGTKFLAALYGCFAEFDFKTYKRKKSKNIHSAFIETCIYSPDKKYILTSSWRDKTLVICKAKNLKKHIETTEEIWVDNAIYNRSGSLIYSGGHDNLVKIWDVSTGGMIRSLAGHDDWVYDLCLSPDEKFLYTAGYDKVIKIWDTQTGKNINTLKGHTEGIVCVDISNDGKWLATGGSDNEIIIWDTSTSTSVKKLKGHEGAVMDVQFSDDSRTLFSCSVDKTIRVWDLTSVNN